MQKIILWLFGICVSAFIGSYAMADEVLTVKEKNIADIAYTGA